MNKRIAAVLLATIIGAGLGTADAASTSTTECLPIADIDGWRVHDRVTLIVQSKGRDIGRIEVVDGGMAGGTPLYFAHRIRFEARDSGLCAERDVVVADGHRVGIQRIVPFDQAPKGGS